MHESGSPGIGSVVRVACQGDPAGVPDMATAGAAIFGGTDVVVYLVDFGQQVLEPLGDAASHSDLPQPEPVGASVAGRAFLQRRAIVAERDAGARVWVPVVEGSEVTGVLSLTLPDGRPERLEACEDLGILVGLLIATQARVTDVYNLHRRRKAMSLAASMQWDLLPPLAVHAARVAAAGMVEPAYDVGGDCFDYALNGSHLEAAMMDSMGHGERSALAAALAMGCYRHDRREARSLEQMHQNLDAVISRDLGDATFVTGQLVRLELDTGMLSWVNAGHPLPLLLRGGRVIGHLDCPPARPWGLGPSVAHVATVSLEPGDFLLLYTDGVVEARAPGAGADFGTERLADLAGQHVSDQLPVTMIVRLLINAVLEHYQHHLRDDATILLVQWTGPKITPEWSGPASIR